jgi:hypothetical protein
MGYMENGKWRPWCHPDYRHPESPYQGWWEKRGSGDVIAVLSVTGPDDRPMAIAAKYNFNEGARGNGMRLLLETLEREYERVSEDDVRLRNLGPT